MLVCRKFDSSKLAEIMGAFVGGLFGEFARNTGAVGWCEDTPADVLHVPFLRRLLPNQGTLPHSEKSLWRCLLVHAAEMGAGKFRACSAADWGNCIAS